jgi:hypothetical protein
MKEHIKIQKETITHPNEDSSQTEELTIFKELY